MPNASGKLQVRVTFPNVPLDKTSHISSLDVQVEVEQRDGSWKRFVSLSEIRLHVQASEAYGNALLVAARHPDTGNLIG